MFLDNLHPIQFILDVLNVIYLFIIIIFFSIKFNFNKKYIIFLCALLFTPFLFYFMFHWSFFPDQSKYLQTIYDLRNFDYDDSVYSLLSSRSKFSSLVLAFFPIPFVSSIISIGLINKGILSALVIYFLIKKNFYFLTNLLVFLPSMIIISSLALRDMLTIALGIFFLFFFLSRKKYLKSFFFAILFILCKPHLGILCVVVLITYYILFIKLSLNSINIISLSISIVGLIIFVSSLLYFKDYLINYRDGYFAEEFGYKLQARYEQISILTIINSFTRFLFSPLSTNEINLINILIFLENLFLIHVKVILLKMICKENQSKALFWIFIWVVTFLMMGFVTFNAGTIWRYKLVLEIFLICAMYFSLKNNKKQIYLF